MIYYLLYLEAGPIKIENKENGNLEIINSDEVRKVISQYKVEFVDDYNNQDLQ